MATRHREDEWEDDDYEDEPPRRRRKNKSQAGTLAVIFGLVTVVALVAVGGVVALGIILFKSSGKDTRPDFTVRPPTGPVGPPTPPPGFQMPQPPPGAQLPQAPPAAGGGQPDQPEELKVGNVAPDIEGEDVDGKKFKLSDYRGKVVVLDFWGHW
jgi:hypothetical protein